MRTILYIVVIGTGLFFFGCDVNIFRPDLTHPSSPQGLYTATGDNLVELFWNTNPETDVAGYNIFVSSSYNGTYELIGTISRPYFMDNGARNGNTYYYAVSAFDYNDNESNLSKDVAYDTPRPEGYDVALRDYRTSPAVAGYDFSTYSTGNYDDQYTDVFFENYQGTYYLNVWQDSDIQDVGYTKSLYDVSDAPVAGWSPTKDSRVIGGHTYIIWTWDDHYAKLRVSSVSSTRIAFDWAYQLQKGNTRLKRSSSSQRTEHLFGGGIKNRN